MTRRPKPPAGRGAPGIEGADIEGCGTANTVRRKFF
jgi:hypothetical protein